MDTHFLFKRDNAYTQPDQFDYNDKYYFFYNDDYPTYKGGIYKQRDDGVEVKVADVYALSWFAVVVAVYGQDTQLTLADINEIKEVVKADLGLRVDHFE